MTDTVSTLAAKLRPHWLRDVGASGGGIVSSGGGGLVAHALSGAYHTGELDPSQAPWALTDAELAAHAADPDAHHARQHSITSASDHTVTGSAWQVVGLTGANTLGLLTPSADVRSGTVETLLKSDSAGGLGVKGLTVGSAMTLAGTNNIATAPDMQFASNGMLAAESSMYFGVDSTNTGTGYAFIFGHNAATSAFTELARITDSGNLRLTATTPTISTAANDLTIDPASRTLFADDKEIRSQTHTAGFLGAGFSISWPLSGKAHLDIRSIYAEEMEVTAFQADVMRVRVAEDFLTQSMGFTATAFTTPAVGASVRVYFENNPAFAGEIFQDNEWVLFQVIQHGTGLLVKQIWGQVSSYIDEGNDQQSWLFTMRSGTVGLKVNKSTLALSFGVSGDGYIHHSVLRSANGPWTRYATWSGANPYTPANRRVHAQAGNLNGLVDITTDRFGMGAGNNLGLTPSTGFSGFLADDTAGLRLFNSSIALYNSAIQTVSIAQTGGVKLGTDISAAGTTTFDFTAASGILRIGPGGGAGASLYWSGSALALRNSATDNVIVLDSSGGSYFAGVMTIGTGGEIRQGTGTLGSDYTGLRIWRDTGVGRIAGYNANVVQWSANTSGEIRFGADLGSLSSQGLGFGRDTLELGTAATSTDSQRAVAWWDNVNSRSGSPMARIYAGRSSAGTGSVPSLVLDVDPANADTNARPSIWLIGKGASPTQLWFNYIRQIVGFPGISASWDATFVTPTVDFSGTLNFASHILRATAAPNTDIGSAGNPFRTLYATNVIATSISGTAMTGQEWEYAGDMLIDATAATNTVVTVANSGAGRADLDVDRNITLGGTVDGVDVGTFKSTYDTHAGNANAHHNQAHVLATNTALGADHTISGATAGHVLRASSATAAAFAQLGHGDLGSVTADQHHAQQHAITGGDHTATGAQYALVGLTGTNTLGLLTPSSNPGATSAILRTNAGALTLATLTVDSDLYMDGTLDFGTDTITEDATYLQVSGSKPLRIGAAVTISPANSVATGPDIWFASSGLVAADDNLHLNADASNTGTGGFIFAKGGSTSAATVLARLTNAGRFGVGSAAPSYELDVTGTGRATVSLLTPLLGTVSGHLTAGPVADFLLSPGSSLVKLQSGVALQSANYASQTTGMRVTYAGEGDFRYLYADEMHVKAFIADLEQALAGGQIISKSVTMLASAFTAPAAGGVASLHVRDLPSATGMQVFQSGDVVRLRTFSRSGGSLSVTDCWGVVTDYVDVLNGSQLWTFTRSAAPNAGAMTAGTVVQADAIALDYGTTGNGFYEVNAIDGLNAINSPYAQIVSWTTHPATGQTVRSRLGNLRGIFSVANEYGLYAGSGVANTDQYLRISNSAFRINNVPLQMWNGSGQTFDLSANGDSMWLGPSSADKRLSWDGTTFAILGQVTATSGYIGSATNGWTIDANSITANGIRLYALRGTADSSRIELGDYTAAGSGQLPVIGMRGVSSGTVATSTIAQWAGRNYANRSTAPFRLTYGGSLTATDATITGAVTANTGYIGGTGGWTIATGQLSSNNIALISDGVWTRLQLGGAAAGATAGVRIGAGTAADVAFWAGQLHDATGSAPFRVTLGGALTATNATITGAITANTGAIGGASGWTIATGKISSGSIEMFSGAAGTARIDLGLAGIVGSSGAGSVNIWAGDTYANKDAAPFRVYDNGSAIINALTIAGNSSVTGSLYAGSSAVRLSTDGQRLVLPNTTGLTVPTSSSAIRWFPSIDGTHDYTKNYTGLVGYRHTGVTAVDMLHTVFVGSTDAATYDARLILQAGHQTGSDAGTTYTDTLLILTREKGAGAKTINAICDTFSASANVYVTGNMSAQSITDRTPAYDGDALAALAGVKGKKGQIDHSTLPAFARRQVRTMDGKQEEGRDLGAMISILVAAVGQLEARLNALEARR